MRRALGGGDDEAEEDDADEHERDADHLLQRINRRYVSIAHLQMMESHYSISMCKLWAPGRNIGDEHPGAAETARNAICAILPAELCESTRRGDGEGDKVHGSHPLPRPRGVGNVLVLCAEHDEWALSSCLGLGIEINLGPALLQQHGCSGAPTLLSQLFSRPSQEAT